MIILLILYSLYGDFNKLLKKGIFYSPFVETLITENSKIAFSGTIHISSIGFRIEVISPEKQILIGRKDSVKIFMEGEKRPILSRLPFRFNEIFTGKGPIKAKEKGDIVTLYPEDSLGFDSVLVKFKNKLPYRLKFFSLQNEYHFIFTGPSIIKHYNMFTPPEWK